MPSLQVRELPEHIYQMLMTDAKKQHRSLAQQAVVTLSKGLEASENPKNRRRKLMSRIQSHNPSSRADNLKTPAALIREDRKR